MGGEMYHAIIAKDYKPLQKLQGFGVHLLLHTNSTAACLGWGAGCARGAWRHSQGWGTALASSLVGQEQHIQQLRLFPKSTEMSACSL